MKDFILVKSEEKSCNGCCFDIGNECKADDYIYFFTSGCSKDDYTHVWKSVEDIKEKG